MTIECDSNCCATNASNPLIKYVNDLSAKPVPTRRISFSTRSTHLHCWFIIIIVTVIKVLLFRPSRNNFPFNLQTVLSNHSVSLPLHAAPAPGPKSILTKFVYTVLILTFITSAQKPIKTTITLYNIHNNITDHNARAQENFACATRHHINCSRATVSFLRSRPFVSSVFRMSMKSFLFSLMFFPFFVLRLVDLATSTKSCEEICLLPRPAILTIICCHFLSYLLFLLLLFFIVFFFFFFIVSPTFCLISMLKVHKPI